MSNHNKAYNTFVELSKELSLLSSANNILDWDCEQCMPDSGSEYRAEALGVMAKVIHEKQTSKKYLNCVDSLYSDLNKFDWIEKANIKQAYIDSLKHRKLSPSFAKELSKTTSISRDAWVKAKENSDFNQFKPILTKLVALKREEAKTLNSELPPYDVMLDNFETNCSSEYVKSQFDAIKDFLITTVDKVKSTKPDPIPLPLGEQKKLNKKVMKKIGLDLKSIRLDTSAHPYMTNIHPGDIRITTKYYKEDFVSSLYSTIHESGHALYENSMLDNQLGLASGYIRSNILHESQSRLWENFICRDRFFTDYVADSSGLRGLNKDYLYQNINCVNPSFIRIEADELTYGLHVILRFEIEKDLINGVIDVDELPSVWNKKMLEYFGLEVKQDSLGVLQDIHWSLGSFGYFPSYQLGNHFAAQLYASIKKDIDIPKQLNKNFADVRAWLSDNVWQYASLYPPAELIKIATGEDADVNHYKNYLKEKFDGRT